MIVVSNANEASYERQRIATVKALTFGGRATLIQFVAR